MPILSRYLLRTFLPTFLLCLGIFLFVLLMNYFLRLFNLAVMKGVSLVWILHCFARLLPYFLSLALPMAFLVSLLLTLGQLSETGEIMALRSSGFSFREILTPYFLVATALSAALLYVNHKASPDGFHAFKKAHSLVASSVSRLGLEPRTFTRLGDWEFYADEAENGGSGRLAGVRLIKRDGSYRRLRVTAPEGDAQVEPGRGVHMTLRGGSLLWPSQEPRTLTSSTFGTYRLFLPFVDRQAQDRRAEMPELSTPRLRERLREPGISDQHRKEFTTEAALRSAGAAAPFVLFWTACPLGLRIERRGKVRGFAMSLGVIFCYYGLLAVGIALGRRELSLSPWGPWLPNVACLGAGAALWWRRLRG